MAETEQRKLAAIMFTDIVGYVALTQQSEAHALQLLEEHNRLLRALFSRHGGEVIKPTGDGFFVEFASAVEAARCAGEIQKTLAQRNASVPAEQKLQVRIGLHVGDVVHRGDDVFGDGVNIAARICPLAEPGAICISQQVFDQVRNQIEAPLVRLGRGELKHVRVPVEIYRIVLPWEKPRRPFADRLSFRLRHQSTRFLAFVSLAALALAGLALWENARDEHLSDAMPGTTAPSPGAGPLDRRRIAVLPFDNFCPDPQKNAYFVDGMTEEFTSRLSNIRGLEVIARTSAMRYKKTQKSVTDIGGELNVRTVGEGSVRKAGNRVRITAQLIDVGTEAHLWADDYEGVLAARRQRARAEKLIAAVLEGPFRENHHVANSLGAAYAQLGRRDAAVRWLRKAVETGLPCRPWYATDPLLQPLRGDPEFERFLKDVGKMTEAARKRYAR
jgi:class 3 adenylate cyclase/TolB-like protein